MLPSAPVPKTPSATSADIGQFPFYASRLKISRAAQHISDLRGEVAAYQARVPIFIIPERDPNNFDYILSSPYVSEVVPSYWGAIIGDAIHNLRASLDLLACEAVRLNGRDDKNVYFPFAASQDEFPAAVRKRHLDRASAEVLELVYQLRPYRGGNETLRGIHELDIQDKHQNLLPLIAEISFPGGGEGYQPSIIRQPGYLSARSSLASWIEPLGMIPGKKIPVGFKLTFPYMGPFKGQELISTLEGLVGELSQVVDRFESLYPISLP